MDALVADIEARCGCCWLALHLLGLPNHPAPVSPAEAKLLKSGRYASSRGAIWRLYVAGDQETRAKVASGHYVFMSINVAEAESVCGREAVHGPSYASAAAVSLAAFTLRLSTNFDQLLRIAAERAFHSLAFHRHDFAALDELARRNMLDERARSTLVEYSFSYGDAEVAGWLLRRGWLVIPDCPRVPCDRPAHRLKTHYHLLDALRFSNIELFKHLKAAGCLTHDCLAHDEVTEILFSCGCLTPQAYDWLLKESLLHPEDRDEILKGAVYEGNFALVERMQN